MWRHHSDLFPYKAYQRLKEVDTTKFKELSQKTINEELDDVLEDFGDDEEANSKLVRVLPSLSASWSW